jgi:hypothetical protein
LRPPVAFSGWSEGVDKNEIISLIKDPAFQGAVKSLSDKSAIEIASFVAVIVTGIVTIAAVLIAAFQLRDLAMATREDHRRSRREFVISLMQFWETNNRHESESTRLFIEL